MTFEVGQRVRTTRIDYDDIAPAWSVGDTGVIQFVRDEDQYANVVFDPPADVGGYENDDIVNFDEMEVIDAG